MDVSCDVDEFGLDLFIDGNEYCNGSRMYGDEGYYDKLSCHIEKTDHATIENVSVQTDSGDLSCSKSQQPGSRQTFCLYVMLSCWGLVPPQSLSNLLRGFTLTPRKALL